MFESFTIPTAEILKLRTDWYDFLKTYEEGKIPRLIYTPPSWGG
jgi:hypothetical protein